MGWVGTGCHEPVKNGRGQGHMRPQGEGGGRKEQGPDSRFRKRNLVKEAEKCEQRAIQSTGKVHGH